MRLEPWLTVAPSSEQFEHEPTEQLAFVYEPLSEPFEQLRVCDVQLLPQETELVWYAVTLAPFEIEPPQGRLQPQGCAAGQLALL